MLRQSRACGARVIVTEMMEKKIKTAKVMGFEVIDAGAADPVERVKQMTGGRGADAVIVAAGATKANEQAAAMLKHFDGRMLMFAAAYPAPELGINSCKYITEGWRFWVHIWAIQRIFWKRPDCSIREWWMSGL